MGQKCEGIGPLLRNLGFIACKMLLLKIFAAWFYPDICVLKE